MVHRDTIELSTEGCYIFTIYDAGGNGICCTNGNGLYLLQDDQETEVVMGGPFGYYEKTEFNANIVSVHTQFDQTRALQVFPNPVSTFATASFHLVNPDNVSLTLYNTFGQKVWSQQPGYLEAGDHHAEIDAGNLANGVYILQLTTENKIYTRKITVNH
ncbi:MAG: T9SS type A sorting domain-containing protein [Bacteroidales bacterium]|nr:T9SS type A sorting domain-containing protein [Bacteroidales bacterium]